MLGTSRIVAILLAAAAVLAAADPSDEHQVRAAMEAWRQARLTHDRAALERLYAPELVYVHSTARRELRAEAIDTIANGKEKVEVCDFTGMSVQVYGGTAVVWTDLTLRTLNEGTVTTLNLGTLHVWVKRPQGWQLVARQAVRRNP